jgi:hypothetical protein
MTVGVGVVYASDVIGAQLVVAAMT